MTKPLPYHELAKNVALGAQTCSSLYLVRGDAGVTEDLVEGYISSFNRGSSVEHYSIVGEGRQVVRELDQRPLTKTHKAVLVRDADEALAGRWLEDVLLRLEREKRNPRLLVLFVGDEPQVEAQEWFLENWAYGVVTEPTMEKLGDWVAAKTARSWRYHTTPKGALVTPEVGLRLAEHCGWDYVTILQAAKTLRAYADEGPLDWRLVSALIPPRAGFGYADALVFGSGRRSALRLAEGIQGAQVVRTLGLVRFYLRQFARLRAIRAENRSDRSVAEESGIHVWHWSQKYKPAYPRYTNDRIRIRLGLVGEKTRVAKAGITTGVLESLAVQW